MQWHNDRTLWQLDSVQPYARTAMHDFAPLWQQIVASHGVWILEAGHQAIGQVGWIQAKETPMAELFITIANPAQRGQGYGRQALAWLESTAANRGLDCLIAKVLGHNRRAMTFFEGLGYTPIALERDRVERAGRRYPLLWFGKTL